MSDTQTYRTKLALIHNGQRYAEGATLSLNETEAAQIEAYISPLTAAPVSAPASEATDDIPPQEPAAAKPAAKSKVVVKS